MRGSEIGWREGFASSQGVRALIVVAMLLIALPAVADAQENGGSGEDLSVYVMTMGPGPLVWERFGHNAIWIRDHARGTDIAYNYGMFSFEQENFILRFVRGHMDYWMEGFDAFDMANAYVYAGRSVWAQELNLTPAERAELQEFLEWNARPENRFYRYDYYLDNCSTRVRDAIDLVLGGEIRRQTENVPTGTTYRDHTRWLTAGDLPIYTGLMVGLGQPVDVEISAWEEMFLPMQLRERIRNVTITREDGSRVPLVASEEVLYLSPEAAGPADAPSTMGYLLGGLLLGALIVGTGAVSNRSRAARIAFSVTASAWALVAGILGLVLVGLWGFTDHATSYRNENLFFFSPFLLPLVVAAPLAARGHTAALAWGVRLAVVVAGLGIIGALIQIHPAFYQANREIIALALPVNLAVALAFYGFLTREQGTPPPSGTSPPVERRGDLTEQVG